MSVKETRGFASARRIGWTDFGEDEELGDDEETRDERLGLNEAKTLGGCHRGRGESRLRQGQVPLAPVRMHVETKMEPTESLWVYSFIISLGLGTGAGMGDGQVPSRSRYSEEKCRRDLWDRKRGKILLAPVRESPLAPVQKIISSASMSRWEGKSRAAKDGGSLGPKTIGGMRQGFWAAHSGNALASVGTKLRCVGTSQSRLRRYVTEGPGDQLE